MGRRHATLWDEDLENLADFIKRSMRKNGKKNHSVKAVLEELDSHGLLNRWKCEKYIF